MACSIFSYTNAVLISDDIHSLREYLANSLTGMALEDEALRTGLIGLYGPGSPFGWRTEEGYCHITVDSLMLAIRGLKALVDENTDASREALRTWLPLPTELLRIAEHEMMWLITSGANHPALLCARLHGEWLGNWSVTVEVVEGVLGIEQFNPLLRTEALRLLGRAKVELGERAAAGEAAERALAEAAGAKYVWLEMLSLRDLLKYSLPGAVEGVRARLRAVVSRMSASSEELTSILGEGVL